MAAEQAGGAAGNGAGGPQTEVALDTSEPTRSAQKVELDLDDAPFLEEEEEVQPEPAKPAPSLSLEPEPEKKPSLLAGKKKLIIIAAAAVVLLLVAGIAVKMLFFKAKPAQEPEKVEQSAPKDAPAENATEAKAPELPEIQVRLEPFWVEQRDDKDEIRFLIVRMLLGTTDQMVAKEFAGRQLAARNAIFYYLKNKDVQFLADEHNAEKLKAELLMVINQYVSDGKFETLMFEEYVVK